MNCDYCGAPLTLEDANCPHCGRVNEQARIHARDMAKYKKEFNITQSSVNTVMSRYKGITARLIILVIAIAVLIVSFVLAHGTYSIYRSQKVKETLKNREEISRRLDEYIEAEDYLGFREYAQQRYIDYSDVQEDAVLGKYASIKRISDHYQNFMLMALRCVAAEKPLEETSVRYVSDNLNSLLKILYTEESYVWTMGDPEYTREIGEQIKKQVKGFMIAFFDFTSDEYDSFVELSDARRAVFLEDKMQKAWDVAPLTEEIADE